jgi:hypothetical protein
MANLLAESLLIGSSNVYRLYKPGKNTRNYKMVNCTRMETFEAHISNLVPDNKYVLISVIENFVSDEVTNEAEPDAEITHCIRTFLKTLGEVVARLPGTRFCIVMPTHRPVHNWFEDRIQDMTDALEKGIKEIQLKLGFDKIVGVDAPPDSTQDFLQDGVHLNDPAAKIFLDHILSEAETFFKGQKSTDNNDDVQDVVEVRSIEERLKSLEMAHKKQVKMNFANCLMMARVREEIDTIANRSKEDRVVMSGLKSKVPMPTDNRERIEWLKKMAMGIFAELIPDFKGKIFYLNQGKQMDVFLPMIEVKLDKAEHALAVRKAFAQKRKNKSLSSDLESLFVTNCVNLATRVRIDVLKSIARRITNDKDIAYVSGFISRPMMHVKKVGTPANVRPLKSYTYIDSVSRFHGLLRKEDLTTAYERAGRAFHGALAHNFVVLNDEDQEEVVGPVAGTSAYRGGPGRRGKGKGFATGTNTTPKGDSSTRGVKRSGTELGSGNAKK